jgi:hypothetical protein
MMRSRRLPIRGSALRRLAWLTFPACLIGAAGKPGVVRDAPWHYPECIKARVIALRDEYERIFVRLIDDLPCAAISTSTTFGSP